MLGCLDASGMEGEEMTGGLWFTRSIKNHLVLEIAYGHVEYFGVGMRDNAGMNKFLLMLMLMLMLALEMRSEDGICGWEG